jgi:hypothetical protein
MPFTPLPTTFLDDLNERRGRPVLELGSGDGAFTAVLAQHGVAPVTLDLASQSRGARARIRGDALAPPLRGGFAVVVASNLLRHLWPRIRRDGPRPWRDLVAPDGCLWILEDEPCDAPAAARHYREVQRHLASLQPGAHAALLAASDYRAARDRWQWPGSWRDGLAENRWPTAPERIAALLTPARGAPPAPIAALLGAIRRDGLSYGRYWWSRWQPEARD